MNHWLTSIIKHHLPCYFISPHLDDAALSAACLMHYLVRKGVPVTVINVFTKGGSGPQTWSAKKAVAVSGYASPDSLYAARQDEDFVALSKIGVRVINLGYTDAPWRRRPVSGRLAKLLEPYLPEVSHIYPTYHWHIASGRVSPSDQPLINQLCTDLARLIDSSNSVVFCPEAIGGHVDHALVKTAVSRCFSPIRWLDQPYSLVHPAPRENFSFPTSHTYKKSLLRLYRTQIGLLFPSGKIPLLEEQFFIL